MQDFIDDLIDDGIGLSEWMTGDGPLTPRSALLGGIAYIVFFVLYMVWRG